MSLSTAMASIGIACFRERSPEAGYLGFRSQPIRTGCVILQIFHTAASGAHFGDRHNDRFARLTVESTFYPACLRHAESTFSVNAKDDVVIRARCVRGDCARK